MAVNRSDAGLGSWRIISSAEEPVTRRLCHRLPWLALGLAGAMLSAWIVSSAEDEIARNVALAFFMPAIVYMADAVGTQTEVLVVRSLSAGIPLRDFFFKEALAGVLIGVLIAVAFYPFCLVLYDQASLALTVSLALFVSSSMAGIIALLLPWLLMRTGADPAFGSGPLATVIQDVLSIVIYLALATAIM